MFSFFIFIKRLEIDFPKLNHIHICFPDPDKEETSKDMVPNTIQSQKLPYEGRTIQVHIANHTCGTLTTLTK